MRNLCSGLGWFDSLGTRGITGFSVKEGREAFGKARGIACCCAGKCGETA